MIIILFVISTLLIEPSWQEQIARPPATERIQKVVEMLEAEKSKIDCKKNEGECWHIQSFINIIRKNHDYDVRHPWMDKMQKLGIKQVSFELEFTWEKDGVHFKLTKANYFQKYYIYNSLVKDSRILRQIKQEELENDLKEFAFTYLRKQYGAYKEWSVKHGGDNLTLFDDEALPIMQWVY